MVPLLRREGPAAVPLVFLASLRPSFFLPLSFRLAYRLLLDHLAAVPLRASRRSSPLFLLAFAIAFVDGAGRVGCGLSSCCACLISLVRCVADLVVLFGVHRDEVIQEEEITPSVSSFCVRAARC